MKVLLTLLMLICISGVYAQRKLVSLADSLITNRYFGVDMDTCYLQRPEQKWTVRLSENLSATNIRIDSKINGNDCYGRLKSDKKLSMSVKVAYRSLSVSLSVNPQKLTGKEVDWSFSVSTYLNRLGGEIKASYAKTLKGSLTRNGLEHSMTAGQVTQKYIYATGYYAFNYRRFSYPAAFTQSYIQKRSAGSWLLGLLIYASDLAASDSLSVKGQVKNVDIGLGGGYGYNWVPGRGWLLHLQGIPMLNLYSYNRLAVNGEAQEPGMCFPELFMVGRAAVIYTKGRYFYGSSVLINHSVTGNRDVLQVRNTQWQTRLFVGRRF